MAVLLAAVKNPILDLAIIVWNTVAVLVVVAAVETAITTEVETGTATTVEDLEVVPEITIGPDPQEPEIMGAIIAPEVVIALMWTGSIIKN